MRSIEVGVRLIPSLDTALSIDIHSQKERMMVHCLQSDPDEC
jgi:hypothetical protein